MIKRSIPFTWLLVFCGLLLPAAAEPEPQEQPADLYFKGWQLGRDAEWLHDAGARELAMEKMQRSSGIFGEIRNRWPDWKTEFAEERFQRSRKTLWKWKRQKEEEAAYSVASDLYFQCLLLRKDAEDLHAGRDEELTGEKLELSLELVAEIRKRWPDWKKEMVGGRLDETKRMLAAWSGRDTGKDPSAAAEARFQAGLGRLELAQRYHDDGSTERAEELLTDALLLFHKIEKRWPDWKREEVRSRSTITWKTMEKWRSEVLPAR